MFTRIAAAMGLAAALACAAPASAAPSEHSHAPCFFISQWQGWTSPSADVLYLGVNLHDVYRVDLSVGSPQLQSPDVHLVSVSHGSSSICSPMDLDLKVSDLGGFSSPLIATKLTKLTPEEVAAIPRKYRP
jgi:hypothetical protein